MEVQDRLELKSFSTKCFGGYVMSRKRLTIWTIAISFTLLPLLALAQPAPPNRGERGHHRWRNRDRNRGKCPILKMYDRITNQLPKLLDMNEVQIDKYNDIKSTHRKALKEICEQLEKERKAFKKELESILTPDQQEKLTQLQKKMRKAGKKFRRAKNQMLRPRLIMQAIKRIDISEDKAQQIKGILLDTRNRFKSSDRRNREQMRKIFKDMIEQIKEVLSPDEYNQLKEIVKDLQKQQTQQRRERPGRRGYNRPGRPDKYGMHRRHRADGGRLDEPPNRPERFGRPVPPPDRQDEEEFLW